MLRDAYKTEKRPWRCSWKKDYQTAHEMAEQINRYNDMRKDLDKSMTEEANSIVEKLDKQSEQRSIVIYNEEWHKGVIGIVASRLTEIYYRPSVVLTHTDNLARGRRVPFRFDVYKAIESCRIYWRISGGHTYAAGLSMKVENVPEFHRRFRSLRGNTYPAGTDFGHIEHRRANRLQRYHAQVSPRP